MYQPKKAESKSKKSRKPFQLKNILSVNRPVPEELISQEEFKRLVSLPNVIEKYTPELLTAAINQYFADPENQPYNLASYQYHLGFVDSELWDNLFSEDLPGDIKLLVQLLRKGIKYIESELVMLLLSRSQVAGLIFYLKAKFQYIEKEIIEQISTQAIDIRFTVETSDEKTARITRETEEKQRLLT